MSLQEFWAFCKECHIPTPHLNLSKIDLRVIRLIESGLSVPPQLVGSPASSDGPAGCGCRAAAGLLSAFKSRTRAAETSTRGA